MRLCPCQNRTRTLSLRRVSKMVKLLYKSTFTIPVYSLQHDWESFEHTKYWTWITCVWVLLFLCLTNFKQSLRFNHSLWEKALKPSTQQASWNNVQNPIKPNLNSRIPIGIDFASMELGYTTETANWIHRCAILSCTYISLFKHVDKLLCIGLYPSTIRLRLLNYNSHG